MRRSTTSRRPSRAAALLPAPRQSGRRRGVGRNATPPAAASSEVVAAETAAADRGRTSKVSSTARQPRSNAKIHIDRAAFEHRRQVLPPGQAWLRWTDGRIYHVDIRRVAAGAAVSGQAEDNGSGSSNSDFFHVHYRGWHARRDEVLSHAQLLKRGGAAWLARQQVEAKACRVCRDVDDAENMILCDSCDDGYHLGCLSPALSSIPHGSWFCPRRRCQCVAAQLRRTSLQAVTHQAYLRPATALALNRVMAVAPESIEGSTNQESTSPSPLQSPPSASLIPAPSLPPALSPRDSSALLGGRPETGTQLLVAFADRDYLGVTLGPKDSTGGQPLLNATSCRPVPQCYPHSATEFVVFFAEDGEYWLLDAIKHARRFRKATQADAKRLKRLAKERKLAGAAAATVAQPPQAPSYRGVDLARGKWRVRVYQGGRHHHIGVYSSAEEAARAHDSAAVRMLGPAAPLNFPRPAHGATIGASEVGGTCRPRDDPDEECTPVGRQQHPPRKRPRMQDGFPPNDDRMHDKRARVLVTDHADDGRPPCCTICQDELRTMDPQATMRRFACGHAFCVECIRQWFMKTYGHGLRCPNCWHQYPALRHGVKVSVAELLDSMTRA